MLIVHTAFGTGNEIANHGQTAFRCRNGQVEALEIPPPLAEVVSGVQWGALGGLLTPASWKAMCWADATDNQPSSYRIGNDIREEVIACLLGGYGIPAEVGYAAFFRLRESGLLIGTPSPETLADALAMPLLVNNRAVRYRFFRSKARLASRALQRMAASKPPSTDEVVELYAWLVALPGIGPKTAHWVIRNINPKAPIAVLDVHVMRACFAMRLFPPSARLPRDYRTLQARFIAFADALGVWPSHLDAMIWRTMKDLGAYGVTVARASMASCPTHP